MHQDFKERLSVFNAGQVRYLIVGGYAVSLHAQPDLSVPFISRQDLLTAKLAAGRAQDQFASASICGKHRVVFNVGGNKYRLVVEVQYQARIVWVKFIGTHAQYDRINVETVNDY